MNAIVVPYIPELRQEKLCKNGCWIPYDGSFANIFPSWQAQGNDALNLVHAALNVELAPYVFMHILLAPCNSRWCKFGPTTDI